jgi:hypothetical protein
MLAVVAALVSWAPVARADDAPTLAPRLSTLLGEARLVVLGDVGAVTEHDEGRLLRAEVRVSRALKGAAEGSSVDVIEDRTFPSVRPSLATGRRVVAFLKPARSTTQTRRSLAPDREYYRLPANRWGVIDLAATGAEHEVVTAIDGWRGLSGKAGSERETEMRRLVFMELGARHERLVEDAAAALPEIPGLGRTLTSDERETLTRALQRTELPERVRLALIEGITQQALVDLAPALRELPGATPRLLEAAALARTRLGRGPDREEFDQVFSTGDAVTRAANVPALARAPGGIDTVAALAVEDPSRDVRLAAIGALGESGSPKALPTLGETFLDPDIDIRRKSAEGIHRIGGREAAKLCADLAFVASPDAQRQAVLLLIVLAGSREDPLVQRIRDTHPSEEIRELARKGITHEH